MNDAERKAVAHACRHRRMPHVVSGISLDRRSLTKWCFLWFTWWQVGKPVRQ